jgi:hypothetical protein
MGGKAVPQGVNTDTLGDAGACRCQANEPMKLARTHIGGFPLRIGERLLRAPAGKFRI